MISRLSARKRGADTNQNIFYLVVGVILLAAAAVGFSMALKTMEYRRLSNEIQTFVIQVKELAHSAGSAQGFSNDTAIVNGFGEAWPELPSFIQFPSGAGVSVTPDPTPSPYQEKHGFGLLIVCPFGTQRDVAACKTLDRGTGYHEFGPLGRSYHVVNHSCDIGTPTIVVGYR